MRFRFVASLALVLGLAASAAAQDEDKKEDAADEFETTWIGVRGELWFQPKLELQARVGGLQGPAAFVLGGNTRIDARDDLNVETNTPRPRDTGFRGGPLGGEIFIDTEYASVSVFAVTPFEYKGDAVLRRTVSFGGFSFQVSRNVSTTLAQAIGGMDIKVNLLNNRFVRLSPVVAVRLLAIDWTIEDKGPGPSLGKATTEDIDFPLTWGRYKVLPYPEVGGEVRAGYREFVEADLKVTGAYVAYAGVTARTALVEAGVTGYVPFVPNIGLRLGFRYYHINAKTDDDDDEQFEANMNIYGATASLIVRF